ncbi:MAG TPA: LPS-assembly protein LptD [Gammaproteobacteria bacterium]|nr:LPS-assembly protein LptD [Gammaproteobacteria bacterium]
MRFYAPAASATKTPSNARRGTRAGPKTILNIKALVTFILLAVAAAPGRAEDAMTGAAHIDPWAPISAWAVCPPQPRRDFHPQFRGNPENAPTYLSGHLAERNAEGSLVLSGEAEAERGNQRLRADRIIYNETEGTVRAEGEVRYDEPLMSVTGTHGTMWIDQNRGELFRTRFHLYDRHGRGKAKKAYLLGPGLARFKEATYTTCPDDDNYWLLRASKVTLDEEKGTGVARNARLNIKGVPVLYSPYISFPIDDRRKTGFLTPSFGSSDNSGLEIRTPFYLNLAPNYDAYIAPRYLERRGTQFNGKFRYLARQHSGTFNIEYLFDDDKTGTNRSRVTVHNQSSFGRHLTTNIDYDRVSDKQYLRDLGDSLKLASVSFLQRTARADYSTQWWNLGLRLDDYQTVDPTIAETQRPYQRLPRLTFNGSSPFRPWGIESKLASEFVRFDANKKVNASRIDLWPAISLPVRRDAFESTPRLSLRYTAYQLDNQAPGVQKRPTRTTPVFSLDNTVYFERDFSVGSSRFTQTLEPRLFYLYVKGEKQEDIPLFDASEPTLVYRELFKENRFNGADRMGDANQMALALTTRLLDPDTGAEKLRASVGELFFFENRNVTLNNTEKLDDKKSDIAGELDFVLSRTWNGKGDIVWNPNDQATERANARIQYHPGFRKIANLSYRYRRSEQSQIDASVLWPLTPSWTVLGRWYYDLRDTQRLEMLAGIEYDSCCWGIRFVARDYIDDDSKENNRVYMAQLVLKGLASFGSNIESLLETGILGYTERPED